MAAVFQAIGNQSAGAASVAVAWPAHAVNDLGIMVIETGGEGTTLAVPSGWTAVTGSPVTDVATTAGSKLQVWYRFATSAAEANVNTGDSGDHQVARIVTFRGVDPITPFDVTPVTATKTTASTTVTWDSITTATANALIVLIATRPDDSTSVAAFSNPVNANLTTLTERGEAGSNAGHGGGFVVVTGTKATAGATGTTTMTCPSVTNAEMVIALREQIIVSTGDGSATETGADTANGVGEVLVQGSSALTEAGDDTTSATGTVSDPAITGSGAAAEAGDDTAASEGLVKVQGDGALTEVGADIPASSGQVIVSGSASLIETGTDTTAATGAVLVQGSGALQEVGNDSAAGSGGGVATGSGVALESGEDTATANGQVVVTGSAALQEFGDDTATGTGTAALGTVTGSGAAAEAGQDVVSSEGIVVVNGSAAATEIGFDAVAANGNIIVTGAGAATEVGDDTAAGSGPISGAITGAGAALEVGDDLVIDYITPGYVDDGYVLGVYGFLGPYIAPAGGIGSIPPVRPIDYVTPFKGRSRRRRQQDIVFMGS